jgi:hypothetical protein
MLLQSSVLEAQDSSSPSVTGDSAVRTTDSAALMAAFILTLKSLCCKVSHSKIIPNKY